VLRARWSITAIALAGAIAIPALASGEARRVVGDCSRSQVRPATIITACGDANIALTHLRWRSFGGVTAVAGGSYSANDCTPNCAAGHFHSWAATIVLSGARRCQDGHDDYRDAGVTFTAARPQGVKSSQMTISLPGCPPPG
jgi:hypothetical protein